MNKPMDIKLQTLMMEPQEISTDVLLEKYAEPNETCIDDIRRRVSKALVAVEKDESKREELEAEFNRTQAEGFVAAGRIQSSAGVSSRATLINCFVQPVGDSISGCDENGDPAIYVALAEAAETMRRGGGVGYNFSKIRPNKAYVKGTKSNASGPLSYMEVFDRSCVTVESAGFRRGAQMAVLRCDHPDVEDYIIAKGVKDKFTNFNMSVTVTDKFMEAVVNNTEWQLVHKSEPAEEYKKEYGSYYSKELGVWVWKTVWAREMWDKMMFSTYDHAEPGILFIDRINQENNLYYCEEIESTNPCAEQPLPPYGCCCLGSLNLTVYIDNPLSPDASFDWNRFGRNIKTAVRMLDNVLDATEWPLPPQEKEAMNKRRIGLGYLGLGDAIIMMGLSYDKEDGREFARQVTEFMRNAAYNASIDLAIEKGSFPLFDADKYLNSDFAKRLPESIRERIRVNGIRNSHLLSLAPTGTIALAFADNASNGLEPPFSWHYDRKKRMPDGSQKVYEVADHAWRLYRHMGGDMENLPKNFVTALDMTVNAHIDMLKVIQPYIDTSMSKTVNIPADYPYEDFKDLYIYAWKSGLKGLSTYRPNNILGSILSVKEEKKEPLSVDAPVIHEGSVASDDKKTIEEIVDEMYSQQFESREDGTLPGFSVKGRFHTAQGEQKFIVVINFLTISRETRFGEITIQRPVEFLLTSNFSASSSAWQTSMRFLSLIARSGVPISKAIENMREITWEHGAIRYGSREKDGKKVPIWHSSDAAVMGYVVQQALTEHGYLDQDGRMTKKYSIGTIESNPVPMEAPKAEAKPEVVLAPTGKKCPECGAMNYVLRDGCQICESCGHQGSCG